VEDASNSTTAKFRFFKDSSSSPRFVFMSVDPDEVTVDGNHPMAGKDLFFDVEIVGVRPATPEEMTHGHAHGAHGQGHH
jgi:FKBP-type peptidyl-prolyl cis-trans isomerase SlyD